MKRLSNHYAPLAWIDFLEGRGDSEGQNGKGTMYYVGDTIFSYGTHFPMATKVWGEDIILMHREGYSVTTSTHMGHVRWAIAQSRFTLLEVPTIKSMKIARVKDPKERRRMGRILEGQIVDEVKDLALKYYRARTKNSRIWISRDIWRKIEDCKMYLRKLAKINVRAYVTRLFDSLQTLEGIMEWGRAEHRIKVEWKREEKRIRKNKKDCDKLLAETTEAIKNRIEQMLRFAPYRQTPRIRIREAA